MIGCFRVVHYFFGATPFMKMAKIAWVERSSLESTRRFKLKGLLSSFFSAIKE